MLGVGILLFLAVFSLVTYGITVGCQKLMGK